MIKRIILLLFLFYILFWKTAYGQDFIYGPATSIMDSKAQFANPAIISFQPSHFSLGVKAYHMGFFENSQFDYRHGYFTLSTPRMVGSRFGSGLQVQYFDSPIFSRSQFGGSASLQILRRLAIGANISLHHIGYNQDNFVGFDFDDPVFQDGFSGYALNTAAGIYARPISDLEIGAGARNINEPDLSLIGANANEPMEIFAAVSYNFGLLKGTFEIIEGRYGLQNRTHIEAYSTKGYYVRAGANMNFDSGYLEAQAHVFGGFSVNYQYELPINEFSGNTSGSHMFSLIYEFNRVPPLPERRSPVAIQTSFERSRSSAQLPSAILLNSDTDHLKLYEINLNRRVDYATVTEFDLAALSGYDIGRLEEQPELERSPYQNIKPTEAPLPETIDLTVSVSDQYRQTIELLKNYLSEERIQELQILINEGSEIRASGLRNTIQEEDLLPVFISEFVLNEEDSALYQTPVDETMLLASDTVTRLNPETARIRPIFTAPINVTNWSLNIFNQNDLLINQINGTGNVPEYIEWDWADNNGELVEPGLYYYNLRWVDHNGVEEISRPRNLYVQKIERNITIDITKDIERIMDDPDQINVILKNN
ncbi:MAG: type IX secretion system membrane protein PorP/SprF [Balneolaceae bacterium]|nr:type IX secretion system membrane protein PorP/SprF [Balneolaceae bacterium]